MSLSALTQGHVVVLAGLLALVLIVGVLFIVRRKPFLTGVGKCVCHYFDNFFLSPSSNVGLAFCIICSLCDCYRACSSLAYSATHIISAMELTFSRFYPHTTMILSLAWCVQTE